MRHGALFVLAMGLFGCSAPPRAASYFRAHPEEDAAVLAACTAGAHRGPECVNAELAGEQIRSDRRLRQYKENF